MDFTGSNIPPDRGQPQSGDTHSAPATPGSAFRSEGHPRAGTHSGGSWGQSLPDLLMRRRSSISIFHCCSSRFCCFILEGMTEVMSYCPAMPQGWILLLSMLKPHLCVAHHLGRGWWVWGNLPPSHFGSFPPHKLLTDPGCSKAHQLIHHDAGSSPRDILHPSHPTNWHIPFLGCHTPSPSLLTGEVHKQTGEFLVVLTCTSAPIPV